MRLDEACRGTVIKRDYWKRIAAFCVVSKAAARVKPNFARGMHGIDIETRVGPRVGPRGPRWVGILARSGTTLLPVLWRTKQAAVNTPPSSALRLTRVSALSLQDFGTRHWDLTCSLTSDTLDKQVWLAKCKTEDPGSLSGTMPKENHLVRGPGLSTEKIELRNWETTRLRHVGTDVICVVACLHGDRKMQIEMTYWWWTI